MKLKTYLGQYPKMKSIILRVFFVIIGCFIGAYVNMSVLKQFMRIIPPPMGADVTRESGLLATIHLFEPKHFIGPFLAHSIGTLIGSIIVALGTKNIRFCLAVGFLFLIGGTMMVFTVPAPLWFDILDLSLAYIPMAWLGFWLTKSISAR
jgi:hypothetical protein